MTISIPREDINPYAFSWYGLPTHGPVARFDFFNFSSGASIALAGMLILVRLDLLGTRGLKGKVPLYLIWTAIESLSIDC